MGSLNFKAAYFGILFSKFSLFALKVSRCAPMPFNAFAAGGIYEVISI